MSGRRYVIEENLVRTLKKLFKSDKEMYEAVVSKIEEIVSSPDIEHYKNLRVPLQNYKRVHIMKSFVLLFTYLKAEDKVYFTALEHHDKVYKN